MKLTKETRCQGSYQPALSPRDISHLGKKFYGKVLGECPVCGESVNVRRGNLTAVAHLPKVAD